MAELRCRNWRAEAILRLLENNLAIAERPDELVVYAAHAKVARDHESLAAIVARAERLDDGQTLVIQSGKPIAVLPTGPRAPAVLIANGNLVGRWATPEIFYELERRGLTMWGGLTAGCWQYIGSQGVLQGTYETFAQVAREHFGGTLRGRLVVTAGLGGMGAAQPIAITRMLDGVCLVAEVDADKARARLREGIVDAVCDELDEALDAGARRRGRRSPSPSRSTPPSCSRALLERGVTPDVATDLTAAHDLRHGYLPVGHHARAGRGPARRRPRQARVARAGDDRAPRAARCSRCATAARSCSTTATTSAPRPRPAASTRRCRSTSSPPATCARCSAAASARSAGSASPARTRTSR